MNSILNKQKFKPTQLEILQTDSGFTIVEVLVVVVIVAILATIAIPSWLSFLNQRRVNVLRGEAYQALQRAQSQAKAENLRYGVSFRSDGGMPEVAVYDASGDATPAQTDVTGWRSLANDYDIQADQVDLSTSQPTIIFDFQGNVEHLVKSNGDQVNNFDPYFVTFSVPEGEDSTQRCVVVETLLGAMTRKQGSDCTIE